MGSAGLRRLDPTANYANGVMMDRALGTSLDPGPGCNEIAGPLWGSTPRNQQNYLVLIRSLDEPPRHMGQRSDLAAVI
ncbi:hypothetical protein PG984_002379 [Apiospora sp. TS-2023a]